MDRKDTLLPAGQEALAAAVFKAAGSSKPVIVLLCNGGAVSIDDLIPPASAIIEAFNPAQQGPKALSALIFGKENRWVSCCAMGAICTSAVRYFVRVLSRGSFLSQFTIRITPPRSRFKTWSIILHQAARTAITQANHCSAVRVSPPCFAASIPACRHVGVGALLTAFVVIEQLVTASA